MLEALIGTEEVAKALGVDARTVRALPIRHIRIARKWRTKATWVTEYLEKEATGDKEANVIAPDFQSGTNA
jgi:hypothetical protein